MLSWPVHALRQRPNISCFCNPTIITALWLWMCCDFHFSNCRIRNAHSKKKKTANNSSIRWKNYSVSPTPLSRDNYYSQFGHFCPIFFLHTCFSCIFCALLNRAGKRSQHLGITFWQSRKPVFSSFCSILWNILP